MNTHQQWLLFLKKHAAALGASESISPSSDPEENIITAEKRLSAKLPPSYRSFLQASNGWPQSSRSVPPLLPVENIQWFRKLHRDWFNAYNISEPLDLPEADYFNYQDCDPSGFDRKHLQHTICISEVGNDAVVLLNPMVVWPDGEWEAWFFANWLPGALRFRSFSDWFRHAHAEVSSEVFTHLENVGELPTIYIDPPAKANRRIRPREKIYDLKTVLKQLKSANPNARRTAAKRMGRIHGPESFEALRQLIRTEQDYYVRMEIMLSIGKIGGDEALDFLTPWIDNQELGSEAVKGIASIRSERASQSLLEVVAAGHRLAPVAAYLLSQRGETRAIPHLSKLLTEQQFAAHPHRPFWGTVIACFGNAYALEALRPLATHADEVVRHTALDGLTLLAFNASRDASVKAQARELLGRSLQTETDPQLRTLIETSLQITAKGGAH